MLVDINGDSVRTSSEEDAKKAAELLNKKHEGANITYKKRTKEKLTLFGKILGFLGFSTEGHTTTETYYVLLPGANTGYDWNQNEFTSALYDVLVSDEVTFNLTFTTEYKGYDIQKFGGGRIEPYAGGGNIFIDPRGKLSYKGRKRFDEAGNQIPYEDAGIVLLHELLGHGHPVGGGDARRVNVHYGSIWLAAPHGGYCNVIGWQKTNLFRQKR